MSEKTRMKDSNQSLSMEQRLGQLPASSSIDPESGDDSLHNVLVKRLVRAMLLREENLITTLLTTLGTDSIKRVAEHIPKAAVLPFISLLADRLRSRSAPRLPLLLWLKHLLTSHSDFFAENPSHILEVADIFPFMKSSLPPLESVMKLAGRFQLLSEFSLPAETSEGEPSSKDGLQIASSAEAANDLRSATNLWSELREPELWNRLEATDVYGYTDEEEAAELENGRDHEKRSSRQRDAGVQRKTHRRKRRVSRDI